MKLILSLVFSIVLLVGTAKIIPAQGPAPDTRGTTSIATLFARDPLTQSLCFSDGGGGNVFQAGQKRNRCSDLYFHAYQTDGFSSGIEGGREAVILDLGTPEELKSKYKYEETVGGGQGFASIDIKNGRALILKDYRASTSQEIEGSEQLFSTPKDKSTSVPVKLGHIYLVRITDIHDKTFEKLAKVLVIAHSPNESVTVRWYLMSNNTTAKL